MPCLYSSIPKSVCAHALLAAQRIATRGLEEALAAFRDDATLARTTIVWKKGNGSSRERTLLIRSCARLGRAEMVLGLLLHNTMLFEDLFLDAIRDDRPAVSVVACTNIIYVSNPSRVPRAHFLSRRFGGSTLENFPCCAFPAPYVETRAPGPTLRLSGSPNAHLYTTTSGEIRTTTTTVG